MSSASVSNRVQDHPLVAASQTAPLRPGRALLSVFAVFSLILELLTLQQLDSLRLYMDPKEILLDAGVALLLVLTFGAVWWLLIFVLGLFARVIPAANRARPLISWSLWLAPPSAYFVARLSGAVRMEIAPAGRVSFIFQLLYAIVLLAIAYWIFRRAHLTGMQSFCQSRLAPLAWLHLGLAFLCVIWLWSKGVHRFKNFERPARVVESNDLPDIYLVTLDALRADETSLHGYQQRTTPNLEKFAERSFTFNYFFTNSNFTTPSAASIETGKFPWSHRVFSYGGFLDRGIRHENLAAILREHGYYTAMISSNFRAAPFQRRTLESYDSVQFPEPLGIEGIWLRYTNLVGVNTQYTLAYSILHRLFKHCEELDAKLWPGRYLSPADAVFARARVLLERPGISQPRFIWTHIYPPHDPYWPPSSRPPYLASETCARVRILNAKKLSAGVTLPQLRSCYDQMVQYGDLAVGEFLDWLDQTGRLDRSLVIISSDHGESFEDNWFVHGGPRLHNGLIHVPMLIHLPRQHSGARISQPSQHVDILPTILDFAGIPIPDWADGISLLPAMQGQQLPDRHIFSMNLETEPSSEPISKGTFAVIDNEFKFVTSLPSNKQALYRFRTDLTEQNDLSNSDPSTAQRLRGVLSDRLKRVNQSFAAQHRSP